MLSTVVLLGLLQGAGTAPALLSCPYTPKDVLRVTFRAQGVSSF